MGLVIDVHGHLIHVEHDALDLVDWLSSTLNVVFHLMCYGLLTDTGIDKLVNIKGKDGHGTYFRDLASYCYYNLSSSRELLN